MPKKRKNRSAKKRGKKPSLKLIDQKLNLILKKENRQLKGQKKFFKLEKEQLEEVEDFENLERKQLKELSGIEELEREIKEQVSPHPLRRITIRDISKALIGAFIGIISHFAFSEGAHLAEGVSVGRASFILLVSF